MRPLQLVVAHCHEDLAWLSNVPPSFDKVVYSKAAAPPEGSIPLPNVGREAHTYLTHIVNHYDTLSSPARRDRGGGPQSGGGVHPARRDRGGGPQSGGGVHPARRDRGEPARHSLPATAGGRHGRSDALPTLVFCQGHPFDHCHDFHKRLSVFSSQLSEPRPITDNRHPTTFVWLGFIIDTDDQRGRRLHVPWSKNPEGKELDLDRCHQTLFGELGPEWYRFVVGAQFAVSTAQILSRPKSFYETALQLTLDDPEASFCLERMWDRIFGVDYVTDDLLPPGQMTRYLKPVRKLKSPSSGLT